MQLLVLEVVWWWGGNIKVKWIPMEKPVRVMCNVCNAYVIFFHFKMKQNDVNLLISTTVIYLRYTYYRYVYAVGGNFPTAKH